MTSIYRRQRVETSNEVVVPLPANWQEVSLAMEWIRQTVEKSGASYSDDLVKVTSEDDERLIFSYRIERDLVRTKPEPPNTHLFVPH